MIWIYKKIVLVIACLVLLWIVIGTFAQPSLIKTIPMTGTTPALSFLVTINGNPWSNGQTVHWGTLDYGVNEIPIEITNVGSLDFIIFMVAQNMPATDWVLTWDLENTFVMVSQSVSGVLTLTVPESAAQEQLFNWDMVLTAIEA